MATQVKRSMPSLVGGIFTAIIVLVLWLLLFGAGNMAVILLGVLVAGGIGAWVRLADL